MGRLIYSLTTSIDGYISDKDGNFAWTQPSEEVLACVNGNLQNVGTFLLGRSMYETLAVWDTIPTDGQSEGMNDFAKIWRAAKKIVYSTSLSAVATADTTIERVFHSEAIQKVVSESAKDFNIGGPHLAAEAIKAGIIDEYHQFIVPLILGDGNYWLPKNVEMKLQLMTLQKFDNGSAHLQYDKV
jgi:dihydrofolate reductase